jgi:two-component system LytT family sensor kinase
MAQEEFEKAKKAVKKKKDFLQNLVYWALFSVFFIFLNMRTSPGFFWAIFPIAGWGLGVLIQGFEVYGFPGFGKKWEAKKLEEELQRIQAENRLKDRYLTLKEKEENDLLNESERLDLKELDKMRKQWDEDELV